jgi:hypothetical protein
MSTKTIASITLTWDEHGAISHELQTFIPTDNYQRADALALSVTLIVASQLGVLAPTYSLALCERLLDFIEGKTYDPELIQYPLSRARVDLHQKEGTIVPTFEPTFLEGGTMEPEEAVRRLLTRYAYHVASNIERELLQFMRSVLLVTISYYLTVALPEDIARPSFSLQRPTPELNLSMIAFCHTIYPQWKGGPSLAPDLLDSHLTKARAQLHNVRRLSEEPNPPPSLDLPAPVSSATPSFPSSTRCQLCGQPAPTKYVEFYRNVGLLVMRFHRSIKGNLCKHCIDRCFWDFTGKTILLGWWGIISFILTPFILLNNLLRFMTTLGMPRPPVRVARGPSGFWVFATITGGLLAILFLANIVLSFARPTDTPQISEEECAVHMQGYNTYIIISGSGAASLCDDALARYPDTFTRSYQPPRSPVVCSENIDHLRAIVVDTSTSGVGGSIACRSLYESLGPVSTTSVQRAQPTPRLRLTPTPSCNPWWDVSLDDTGRQMCVYGDILVAYDDGQAFYIAFSREPDAFYFLSYDVYFPDLLPGSCVLAEGQIQRLGTAPVIVLALSTTLHQCP